MILDGFRLIYGTVHSHKVQGNRFLVGIVTLGLSLCDSLRCDLTVGAGCVLAPHLKADPPADIDMFSVSAGSRYAGDQVRPPPHQARFKSARGSKSDLSKERGERRGEGIENVCFDSEREKVEERGKPQRAVFPRFLLIRQAQSSSLPSLTHPYGVCVCPTKGHYRLPTH